VREELAQGDLQMPNTQKVIDTGVESVAHLFEERFAFHVITEERCPAAIQGAIHVEHSIIGAELQRIPWRDRHPVDEAI
jgi:hypothetical protein